MDFQKLSSRSAQIMGNPICFIGAMIFVLLWAISGPFLNFSSEWQLTINTATTIITFLMVFLIQASQNNDTRAIHLKLDEILNSIETASNEFIGAEHRPREEVTELAKRIEGIESNGS